MKRKLIFFAFLFHSFVILASVNVQISPEKKLENLFKMNPQTPGLPVALKKQVFQLKQNSVPTLIKVMKNGDYPDQNRWQATMLLAQIMGQKSAPFIAKFIEHPNWMMRVASLKALLGLGQNKYVKVYRQALKDPSLIVRTQALDNVSKLGITSLGSDVWKMLYDESNYTGNIGNRKRTSIVKSVIKTLGDIKFSEASRSLAKLIQKPKYEDLSNELNYSLERLTGKKSPAEISERRKFWTYLISKN
jgi:hypothetical protein